MKSTITLLLTFFALNLFAQNPLISMIGDALQGWGTDVDMSTTDGVTYTLENYTFTNGGAKFRQDHDWAVNWGGNSFPSGTAIQEGSNIPVVVGTYNVTFNLNTLEYNFELLQGYSSVELVFTGSSSPIIEELYTTDGITYFFDGYEVTEEGVAYFRQDHTDTINWSNDTFPSGTGVQDGPKIPIAIGNYNVTFNIQTGDYNFGPVTISLIGAFSEWTTDLDMSTSDGVHYLFENFVHYETGTLKFRQNHNWAINWGGSTFPGGTAELNGLDLVVLQGEYNVTFNRNTLEYYFEIILGNDEFNTDNTLTLFPNPATTFFVLNKEATQVEISDLNGKVLKSLSQVPNGNISVNDLNKGVYFVKIRTQNCQFYKKLIVE